MNRMYSEEYSCSKYHPRVTIEENSLTAEGVQYRHDAMAQHIDHVVAQRIQAMQPVVQSGKKIPK